MANEIALATDKVPAHVKESAGRGNENVSSDSMTIPRIKLLQKMSPEVDKHHANFIEGADPGDFLNSLTNENYGSDLYAISVTFKDDHVVWKKREAGGGFLGTYRSAAEAETAISEQDKPEEFDLVQTHSLVLLLKDPKTGVLSMPVIMDFASSKLRVSRSWNSQISIKGGDRFSGLWKLSAVATQNRSGQQFMNLDVSFEGWAQEADYKLAEEFYEKMKDVTIAA